jgi:hypothetical protein
LKITGTTHIGPERHPDDKKNHENKGYFEPSRHNLDSP